MLDAEIHRGYSLTLCLRDTFHVQEALNVRMSGNWLPVCGWPPPPPPLLLWVPCWLACSTGPLAIGPVNSLFGTGDQARKMPLIVLKVKSTAIFNQLQPWRDSVKTGPSEGPVQHVMNWLPEGKAYSVKGHRSHSHLKKIYCFIVVISVLVVVIVVVTVVVGWTDHNNNSDWNIL